MTAILLDLIFISALSKAFSVTTGKLLSLTHQDGIGFKNESLSVKSNTETETASKLLCSNSENCSSVSLEKMVTSLSPGQQEVAMILDAFVATYNAAYRYIHTIKYMLMTLTQYVLHSSFFLADQLKE